MKYPWDDKNVWFLPNEKAAFLKGVQAGRDAQRESDMKAILATSDINSPVRIIVLGFATVVENNTGDI